MQRDYWEQYYATQQSNEQPSDFAQYCTSVFKPDLGCLFDVGCGNARDSIYFSSNSISVIGIDQSKNAIKKNIAKAAKLGLDTKFFIDDFTCCDYQRLAHESFSIYSRFTLHAINHNEEKTFLHLCNGSTDLKYLFIEARSVKDNLYGKGDNVGPNEFVTTHYRRFIEPNELRKKLSKYFEILYFEEGYGFAKNNLEDPCIIRVIAKKVIDVNHM
ncbi:MAG: class I SAM-dependent methyltransferase [Candidatus Latescibacterota bacterium]|nr:class I SAM-dependent methyltransferase [Candidatus Latescibacterota bacterium]